jgi:beta-glucosidase
MIWLRPLFYFVQTFCWLWFTESGRDYNTVDVSEIRCKKTIFPPFKAAVDAGVRTL